MANCKPIGYFVECPETHKLIELFGDGLEMLTANVKLRLISAISLWLADDSGRMRMIDFVDRDGFLESEVLIEATQVICKTSPENALSLVAALIEQLRNGVYAE